MRSDFSLNKKLFHYYQSNRGPAITGMNRMADFSHATRSGYDHFHEIIFGGLTPRHDRQSEGMVIGDARGTLCVCCLPIYSGRHNVYPFWVVSL